MTGLVDDGDGSLAPEVDLASGSDTFGGGAVVFKTAGDTDGATFSTGAGTALAGAGGSAFVGGAWTGAGLASSSASAGAVRMGGAARDGGGRRPEPNDPDRGEGAESVALGGGGFAGPAGEDGDRRPLGGDRRPPSGDRRPPSGDRGPPAPPFSTFASAVAISFWAPMLPDRGGLSVSAGPARVGGMPFLVLVGVGLGGRSFLVWVGVALDGGGGLVLALAPS